MRAFPNLSKMKTGEPNDRFRDIHALPSSLMRFTFGHVLFLVLRLVETST